MNLNIFYILYELKSQISRIFMLVGLIKSGSNILTIEISPTFLNSNQNDVLCSR